MVHRIKKVGMMNEAHRFRKTGIHKFDLDKTIDELETTGKISSNDLVGVDIPDFLKKSIESGNLSNSLKIIKDYPKEVREFLSGFLLGHIKGLEMGTKVGMEASKMARAFEEFMRERAKRKPPEKKEEIERLKYIG